MISGDLRRYSKEITPGKAAKRILSVEEKWQGRNFSSIGKEATMKASIRDKAEGTFHELKGKVKEMAGKLSDNPKLEAEGTSEKIAGKVQEKIGEVKKVLGE